MRCPGLRRQRRLGGFEAGLADEGLDAFRRHPGNYANEMGEAQVRPHLPQPVGGGRRHVAQAILGLAEFGERQPLLPLPVAQYRNDRRQYEQHNGALDELDRGAGEEALDDLRGADEEPSPERNRDHGPDLPQPGPQAAAGGAARTEGRMLRQRLNCGSGIPSVFGQGGSVRLGGRKLLCGNMSAFTTAGSILNSR
jgi:hypothetical protein